MTLQELLMIKKCADCSGVDRDKLGAAVLYNMPINELQNQHVINFRVVLYNCVIGCYRDREIGNKGCYKNILAYEKTRLDIQTPEDAWEAFIYKSPLVISEEDKARIRRAQEAVSQGYFTGQPEKLVEESTPKLFNDTPMTQTDKDLPSIFKRLTDSIKGLFT